jgi:transcriptional activator for dhaKLM operon
MNSGLSLEQRINAWNEFIGSQQISYSLDPLILDSWKRCWGRLNPYQKTRFIPLNPDHLLMAQVSNFELISVARPVMEDIYQYAEFTGIVVVLVNNAGCILDLLGDADILEILEGLGIVKGIFLSESQAGTNAFALALAERVPVQVTGAEHYLQQFQHLADAATPVFDLTGRPLGAFGLFTRIESYQPQALSLTVAGARAIEGQRISDQLLAEQNRQLAGLNAILNSISEGILVWNAENTLIHVNDAAAHMFNLPVRSLVGRSVGDTLSYPAFIKAAMDKKESLTDVEASIKIGSQAFDCLLSLRFVENQTGLHWIIASFRLGKDVTRLVQRQFGSQAAFSLEDIHGVSPAIQKVRRLVRSAAAARASILVCGGNGTGKNILVSAIHNESPRRDGPFLTFPCSSIPTESVIPEMLGFEEDFSTSRPGGRLSKFELAQGGTLHLQDIDALSLEAQGILLNIIETGVVHRMGSDRPIPIDVRFIASTAANMEKLIAEGSFRSDLYYRISPFEIKLPALRERESDIPILAERILNRLAQQLHRPLSFDPEVIDLFKKYLWPGNLREMDAVISRAAGHAGDLGIITPEHLPGFIQRRVKVMTSGHGPVEIQSLEEIEGSILLQTADLCNGNISEMARLLGIGRTTVWRKLKEFKIPVEEFRQRSVEVN